MTISDHMCLDKKFQDLFVVKKITKAMEQIQSDPQLQQIAIMSMQQDNPYGQEEQKQALDTISECEEQAITGSSAVKTGDLGQKSGSLAMMDSAPRNIIPEKQEETEQTLEKRQDKPQDSQPAEEP